MNLTYEKYMELIPKHTKKVIEAILPYLWVYIKKNKSIRLKNIDAFNHGITKKMQMSVAALLGASEDLEMKSMFESKGFYPSKINFYADELPNLTETDKKDIFEQCLVLFTPYTDITKYTTIEPIDIINNAVKLEDNYYFNEMLNYIKVGYELKNQISETMQNIHREIELELEMNLFSNLPVSTINYLETASKIRTIIINSFKSNNIQEQEFLKNDDSYIVPISLLYSMYLYDGKEKDQIVEYFKSNGVTLDNIKKYISGLSTQNLRYEKSNLESIKELYKKYWTTGVNKDTEEKNVEVTDILLNVLDRNFTGVVIIDKLFERIGTNTSEFKDLKKKIELSISRKKMEDEINYAKNFYKDLRKDTKDFINFASKAYQIILKKMNEGNHNTDILNCEDDADTLALYIASHFYNTDFEIFYTEHGVTFESVMNLLGISITMEEIEKEEINQKLVVDKFKRFVLYGVNNNRRPDQILINDVAHNLCDRDFNKSMIMENIFEEIRRDIDLPSNFMKTLQDYFENKEQERKNKLLEEYFIDKPNSVYNFLESTCRFYVFLQKYLNNKEFNENDLISLSLLYALFNSECETKALYEHMGLTKSILDKYLNISSSYNLNAPIDIDLIINKIDPFITQIREKDKKDSITVEEISENIFTSKRTKSLQLTRLLALCNLSYESFDDLTVAKNELKKKIEEEKIIDEANGFIKNYTSNASTIIKNATKLYQTVEEYRDDISHKLTSDNIVDISILLSILGKNDYKSFRFFKKHNIDKENIINSLGLPSNLYTIANEKQHSAKCLLAYFTEYKVNDSKKGIDENDILNILLRKNSDVIRKTIESAGVDYEVFKRECLTGKDYESTLSIDDRCSILNGTVTPDINLSSATNIVTYGSELSDHTSFINNYCTELMLKSQNTEVTETIQSTLKKVYEKRNVEAKQTWFERFMGLEAEASEEISINSSAINELKSVVSMHIAPLHEDIKSFDSLIKYLETYRKKIIEHREKATVILDSLAKELQTVDEDDFEKILRIKTYIKAVESRIESFELTNQLIKQYIYKSYLVIQSNIVTISGLEMSKNILIPLLETEVMIGNSMQNQSNGALITKSVVNLLSEVINKNAVGIQQGLETIKNLGIKEEKISMLSHDIAKYLSQISEISDYGNTEQEALPDNVKKHI